MRWTEKVHAVRLEQLMHRVYLLLRVGLVQRLLSRRQVLVRFRRHLADRAEEVLHLTGGVVHLENLRLLALGATPDVGRISREEDGFARAEGKPPVAHEGLNLAR